MPIPKTVRRIMVLSHFGAPETVLVSPLAFLIPTNPDGVPLL